MHLRVLPAFAGALLISAGARAAEATPTYHIAKTVLLGAPDHWDLISFDAASQRVFVAHGDRVTVIDGHDGTIVGNVEGIPGGTQGVAVGNGHGYTDDGEAGELIEFDLKTLKTGRHFKAEPDADAVSVDPASGHVFVVDAEPGHVTVVDPAKGKVVATIDGGGSLEQAVLGGNGKIYVNGEEKHEILRIDIASNKIDARWPMPGCEEPKGIAMDTATHRLFSSCSNGVMTVVNAETGAVVATLPIGRGSDGAAFDPKRKLVLIPNGKDGTMSIIREDGADHFVAAGLTATARTGRTISIDPASGRLYIAAADIDPKAPVVPGKRPTLIPGSLKLLFLDPDH